MTEKINTKQLKQISTDGNLGTSDAYLPTQNAVKTYVDTTANNLQNEIDDLSGRGRFLSIWNSATGLAETNPPESPYTYQAGDYFVVGTVDSTTNYKPDGSSYTTGVASTTVETNEVHIDDTYFYDGTTWKLQANSQREYTFSGIAGSPYDNTALGNALNGKVDETNSANQVYGTDNNGDPTTYNTTDFGAVDDVQVDGVSVVTSKIANIDLTNYVTLSTTQAITGTKTFKSEILSWNNITFESAQANPIIRGMSGASYRNMITRTNSSSAIDVGNTSDTINLKGSGTRPTYNSNDLAMYSDVPSLTGYIQNTATGTDSLTVLGTATSATNALNVGTGAGASGNNAVAYGNYASAEGEGSIAIGSDSSTTYRARATHKGNIAIGHDAYAINDKNAIAIGESAHANGKNTIQLGTGNNTTSNSFKVASYQLLDTSTGLIPDARISANIARLTDLPTTLASLTGDVTISSPSDGQHLVYDANAGVWKNTTSAASVSWGGITGTLSDQTDLNNALAGKADTATTLAGYGITDGANTDLSNLTSTGANIGNWSSNVTNCITEIPQDIKLELSSGTLTLKAGSKVYVPNGAGVFDEITIANDVLSTSTSLNGTNIYLYSENFGIGRVNNVTSGSSAPVSPASLDCWYDTTNNLVKRYNNGWETGWSFPFMLATGNGSVITSINKVFNGFGYIGTAWFMLPSVKALVPNGLNTDGTYKNIEFTNPSVYVYTPAASAKRTVGVEIDTSGNIINVINAQYKNMDSGKILPTTVSDTQSHFYYKIDENQWYYTSGSTTASWSKSYIFYAGTRTDNGTTTSEFTIRTAFHSVDYSDTEYIAHQGMPSATYDNLTLGSSGASYTAPADGYVCLEKVTNSTNQYIRITGGNIIRTLCVAPASGSYVSFFVPVSKGQNFTIQYSAGGTTNLFRFVYAQGAK